MGSDHRSTRSKFCAPRPTRLPPTRARSVFSFAIGFFSASVMTSVLTSATRAVFVAFALNPLALRQVRARVGRVPGRARVGRVHGCGLTLDSAAARRSARSTRSHHRPGPRPLAVLTHDHPSNLPRARFSTDAPQVPRRPVRGVGARARVRVGGVGVCAQRHDCQRRVGADAGCLTVGWWACMSMHQC